MEQLKTPVRQVTPAASREVRVLSAGRVVTFFLVIHALLLAWGACVHSPTLNEPGHLVAGLSYWQLGQFDVYNVNPPLVRLLAALPVIVAHGETDWRRFIDVPGARPEFVLGEDFVEANGERSALLFTLARVACIPFSILGGYVSYRWARDLYGTASGLIATILWCFSPNILAHGQLVTCDAAASAIALFSCYTFWCWLNEPSWSRALFSGLALGAAGLTKTTLLIFWLLWPLMWAAYRCGKHTRYSSTPIIHELAMVALGMLLVGVYIINVGYAFEGTGTPLGAFRFSSSALAGDENNRFAGSLLGSCPVPFPKNYILGLDLQKAVFEASDQYAYLGELNTDGWWYQYIYVLAIKVPLPTWILLGISAVAKGALPHKLMWWDEMIVVIPAVSILACVSIEVGSGGHMRYVLPILPFIFVSASGVARMLKSTHKGLRWAVAVSIAWSVASSMVVYPHTLSYSNELGGGPIGGASKLIHSNSDWGQGLLMLKRWASEHPEARPITLAYFGALDPRHLGIDYTDVDLGTISKGMAIPEGWYAISATLVHGFPCYTCPQNSTAQRPVDQQALMRFQEHEPVDTVGYSIFIYHIDSVSPNEQGAEGQTMVGLLSADDAGILPPRSVAQAEAQRLP